MGLVPDTWRPYIRESDGTISRRYYELCTLWHLRSALRAGNVWVAAAGGVCVLNVRGEHLGTIKIPEAPSNCNWGEGFRNLYVTARTSVYKLPARVNGTRTF